MAEINVLLAKHVIQASSTTDPDITVLPQNKNKGMKRETVTVAVVVLHFQCPDTLLLYKGQWAFEYNDIITAR
jgi:hypothetical protein